jgi:uncharacterized protein
MINTALIMTVKAYRLLLSPWLGSACRFEPTCSVYSIGALERHGAARGSYLTLKRLARCHPWCEGGHDPVPQGAATATHPVDSPRLFTRLLSSFSHKTPS